MYNSSVYFVDDDKFIRLATEQSLSLSLAGYTVTTFSRAQDTLQKLYPDWCGVIVMDLRMPGINGVELLQRVHANDLEIPMILVSGHADIATAVSAIQGGAYDFIVKPFAMTQLIDVTARAMDKRSLVLKNRRLRTELALQKPSTKLLGISKAIFDLNKSIDQVSNTDTYVLVLGETGTLWVNRNTATRVRFFSMK